MRIRGGNRATLAVSLMLSLPLVGGCPVPQVKSDATVTEQQLPKTAAELIKYGDDAMAKENAVDVQNALVAYDRAHTLDPKNYEAAWKASRASAWLADDLYDDKTKRAHYSGVGRDYGKAATDLKPDGVEGWYYYGINTGLWATTETVGAKLDAPKMRDAEKKAAQLDPKFAHGGAYRALGALYTHAPPWPASFGDSGTGVDYMKKALQVAPDYPQNNLLYGDALAADGQGEKAIEQYHIVLNAPPRDDYNHFLAKWKRLATLGIEDVTRKQSYAPQ